MRPPELILALAEDLEVGDKLAYDFPHQAAHIGIAQPDGDIVFWDEVTAVAPGTNAAKVSIKTNSGNTSSGSPTPDSGSATEYGKLDVFILLVGDPARLLI